MASGIGVGDIFLNLKVNDKGLNTQLNGIGKIAKKAGLAVAAAFSVKELVQFGKACIDLGSDLAEVQNVVDVAFPTMSKQIDSFAAGAAKNFGVSETMAKRFSGTFGSMATAFGFAEGEAATMATTLTGLAGDLASFYNISQDEAYTKLKSVFTGETEALKDLGVVMTQTALDSFALANGFGKTTKQMTEAEKVALRYSFVQDKLSNAAGDFARTSDSWANQVRILSLQFDTLKAAIGEGLINILKPVVQWLNKVIERLITAAKAFAEFTKIFARKDSDKINETLESANSSADNLGESASSTADSFSAATSSAKELKRTLAGFDQITKVDAETDSSTGGNAALGGIDSSISAAVKEAGTQTDTALNEFAEKVKTKMTEVKDNVVSVATSFAKGFTGGVTTAVESLKEFNKTKLDSIKENLSNIGGTAVDISGALAKIAKAFESESFQKIVEIVTKIADVTIMSRLDTITGLFSDLFEWFFRPLIDNADGIKDVLTSVFDIISALIGPTGDLYDGIAETSKKYEDTWVHKFFVMATEDRTKNIKTTLENIKKSLENLKKLIEGDIKLPPVLEKILSLMTKTAPQNIISFLFKGKTDKTLTQSKDTYDSIKNGTATKTAKGKRDGSFNTTRSQFLGIKSITATLTVAGKRKDSFNTTRSQFIGVKSKTETLTAAGKKQDSFNTARSQFLGIVSNLATKTISGKIASAFVSAKNEWAGVTDKTVTITYNAVSNGGASGIHPAPVPAFASGGYVRANTPTLAVIGDNHRYDEYVMPENKLLGIAQLAASLASSGGGRDAEIVSLLSQLLVAIQGLNLSATVDVVALKKLIVRLINEHTQSTGVCEIYV